MPWISTKAIIPPLGKELIISKSGSVSRKKLEELDVYDGRGGIRSEAPEFWQHGDGDEALALTDADPKGMLGQHDQEQHIQIKPIFPEAACADTSPT